MLLINFLYLLIHGWEIMGNITIDYFGNKKNFAKEIADIWVHEWSNGYSKEKAKDQFEYNTQCYSTNKPPFILVAHKGNELLGTVALYLNELDSRPKLDIWLGSLYVKNNYRSKGIAKQLISKVIEKAKELGYKKIYLKTKDAQGYFEKQGWHHLESTIDNFSWPIDIYYIKITH